MRLLTLENFQVELMATAGVIRAVDGISLHIDSGETVTIIGESGSGKSTTAMGLLRLLPDDLAVLSGTAEIEGKDVTGSRKVIDALRGRAVALIPQDPMTALSPIATVGRQMGESITLTHGRSSKEELRAKVVDLMNQVHIRDPEKQYGAYPHELSGGMLQRVLIAIALATEANLIVADEPTSALDVTVQAGILDLLLELQSRTGVGILLITHDLGVARLMSDRVHVMKTGAFVEGGSVLQVVDHPQHPYTRQLLSAIPELGSWTDPMSGTSAAADDADAPRPPSEKVVPRG